MAAQRKGSLRIGKLSENLSGHSGKSGGCRWSVYSGDTLSSSTARLRETNLFHSRLWIFCRQDSNTTRVLWTPSVLFRAWLKWRTETPTAQLAPMTEDSRGSLSAILQIGIPDGMPGKVNPGVLPVEDPGCHDKGNHGMNAVGGSKVNPATLGQRQALQWRPGRICRS